MAGRPTGAPNKDKPFRDALRMELAAAGEDHKALREIARNLIDVARHPDITALPAIREVADRLDGKPRQETEVNVSDKREATDWSRDELVRIIDGYSGGLVAPEGRRSKQVN